MAQLDTLEVYENLIAGGFSHEQAHAQVRAVNTTFNRILLDFASNKIVAIFGTLVTFIGAAILGVGSFTLYKVWDMSIDLTEVKVRLYSLETRVDKLDNDFNNFIKR